MHVRTVAWAGEDSGQFSVGSCLASAGSVWNIDRIMENAPAQRSDLEIVAADEGFVVHDASRGVVHYLNQTAAIVLSLCNGERTVDEIAALVGDQYGLEEAPQKDVEEILSKLGEQGLLLKP